jgi:hypothetical protein
VNKRSILCLSNTLKILVFLLLAACNKKEEPYTGPYLHPYKYNPSYKDNPAYQTTEGRRMLIADVISKQQVIPGMTASEVRQSLGAPSNIHSSLSPENNARIEIWHYIGLDSLTGKKVVTRVIGIVDYGHGEPEVINEDFEDSK